MSQVTSRPARPPRPVAAPAPAAGAVPPSGQLVPLPGSPVDGPRDRAAGAVFRSLFEGSPGRLRLAGVGAVLACLVFALLGAAALQARGNALADANADATQLIRVQQIATEVVRADSLLTNAFPTPDAETADQVAQFNDGLSNAAQLIAEAAAANPADGAELAQVSDALGQYRQYATSARIFNKDGKQVALGYLRQAGTALRGSDEANPNLIVGTGMLPALNDLIKASTDRVDSAYSASGWATLEMIVADVVALGGLVLVQVWLARRTRRYVNVPLVAATGGVLVVLIAGAFVMVGAQGRATSVRDTSYTALTSLADARIAANAAKSDASISFLYLRTGGSSASFQKDYKGQTDRVEASLRRAGTAAPSGTMADFTAWRAAADPLAGTQPNDWPKVAATLADAGQAFNKPFLALDDKLKAGIAQEATKVDRGLGDGNAPLAVLGWLALVVGVVAAVVSWAGIAQRLEDYR